MTIKKHPKRALMTRRPGLTGSRLSDLLLGEGYRVRILDNLESQTHRLLNGQPPVLREDGGQPKDVCFVGDVARANLLTAEGDALDGLPVNTGSGKATTIRGIARMVFDALGMSIEPIARGRFGPGEMRHLTSEVSRAASVGCAPEVGLAEGIARYLEWIRTQGEVRGYFAEFEKTLQEKRIVRGVAQVPDAEGGR